jgi:hypothetical protein
MATQLNTIQRLQIAKKTRERFLVDAQKILVDLGGVVQNRLTTLMNETGTSRDMQNRRDAWMLYQKLRNPWINGTQKAWQEAFNSPQGKSSTAPKKGLSLDDDSGLSLVGDDAVENKILASRMVLAVAEKMGSELDDLRVRVKTLESREELDNHDILRPEVLLLLMIEQWATCGMTRESWSLIADEVQKHVTQHLKTAYANGNQFLIQQGIMPNIDFKDRLRRAAAPRRPAAAGGIGGDTAAQELPNSSTDGWYPSDVQHGPASGRGPGHGPNSGWEDPSGPSRRVGGAASSSGAGYYGGPSTPTPEMPVGGGSGQLFGGRLGWERPSSRPAGLPPAGASRGAPQGQSPAQMHQAMMQGGQMPPGGAHDETRLMTYATPLSRTRGRAQGMFGQLKRLLVGQGAADFGTGSHGPSPALAAAIAERPSYGASGGYSSGSGTIYEDYSPVAVVKVAEKLREKTDELKQKAETKGEKATIEMVALMFQAILAEDRIPSAIRVWFARLQMPVLRIALSDPDFFASINHPARQLIDRMGSCVLGFDASGIAGSALEAEIKRIVQVIEQYPETGKRVFEIVLDEFQKFLAKFLTGKEQTQKVVSVAQQVEQKETLAIQYTIEMRNLLKDLPVREEIRTFLFKVWAEVLAISAVRKGPKDAETVALKKAASDLIWSASAKPNRADRTRVIQDLPDLLQRLRGGMNLLSMPQGDQEVHIKIISDTMADAFMSKTQAIPQAQIDALTQHLANLEDFVSEDGLGDLPLDAESIEMLLGIDASSIDVVTNGGSRPTPAMVAWAQELQVGAWFTLDHNGKVNQVQFAWRSDRKHLNLFASSDGHSYLIQAGRLAAYLQAGLLLPQEEETLTVRATREALSRLEANPERLVR